MGNTWTVNIANDILIFHNVIMMLLLIICIFYCLRIPYVCTMYLIHLISSSSPSISLPLLPPSFIHFLLFSLGPWVCLMLSVQGHGTIYWNMDSLLGLTSLKKTGSPSPNDHQLPTPSQLETRLLEHLPTPCLDFLSGLTLCRHCQCCHSCCVFMSAADILILEITVPR